MRLSLVFNLLMTLAAVSGVACSLLSVAVPSIAFNAAFLIGGSFTVMALALAAATCAGVFEKGRLRMLMLSGMAAAVIAMIVWPMVIRFGPGWPQDASRVTNTLGGSASVWAGWCTVIALVCGRRAPGWLNAVSRALATLSVSLLAIVIEVAVVNPGYVGRHDESFGRTLVALIVMTLATALSAMIAGRWRQLGSAISTAEEEQVRLPLRLWCPRCGCEQAFITGGSSCLSCGLFIKVVVP